MKSKKGFLVAAIILAVISAYLIIGTLLHIKSYDLANITVMIVAILAFSVPSAILFRKYFKIHPNQPDEEDIIESESIGREEKPLKIKQNKIPQSNRKKIITFCKWFVIVGFCVSLIVNIPNLVTFFTEIASEPLVEGFTAEDNRALAETLNSCGIAEKLTDIDSIEHDELLDDMNAEGEKGYRLSANGVNNIIVYTLGNKVNMIRYADNTLYENGAPVDNISNYVLTDYEESRYLTQAENAVESILKSPSSAKFSNILESNIWIEDGVVTVQGYVDAQNSYGAEMRGDYQVQFEDGTITSLIFDGTEYLQ